MTRWFISPGHAFSFNPISTVDSFLSHFFAIWWTSHSPYRTFLCHSITHGWDSPAHAAIPMRWGPHRFMIIVSLQFSSVSLLSINLYAKQLLFDYLLPSFLGPAQKQRFATKWKYVLGFFGVEMTILIESRWSSGDFEALQSQYLAYVINELLWRPSLKYVVAK